MFGVELPEEIGLEGGQGGLVFEICLDEGCLNLLVRYCDGGGYFEKTFLMAAGYEPVVESLVEEFIVGAIDEFVGLLSKTATRRIKFVFNRIKIV